MTPSANDPLLRWRDEFPILQDVNYLVSHSLGAMPCSVYDSLRAYADVWAGRGVRAWGESWWALNGDIGDQIGQIIHAPPGCVSIHQNASLAASILLSGMDFSDTRRDTVVITDMIFPTIYYVLKRMLPAHMRLRVVRSEDGIHVPTERLLEAIDERVALVSVSHVLFRSGYIMPAAAIVEQAHRVGATVMLDAYHSVGIIPVDVTALGVDYLIGGVLKWMCGGPGGVFLYVRPDLIGGLEPRITGWFAHKRPFDFEVDDIEWRDDAYRFLNGTFGVPSLYAIRPGIETIASVGVDAIRRKSMRQTALLFELAEAAGWRVRSPQAADERGGMVVLDVPHSYAVSQALIARNIIVDYRENAGIRVAPHFYNSDDEVRAAVAAIQDILDSGAWEPYSGGRSFVT